jgi:NADH-quinone oxidoreductase subunit F
METLHTLCGQIAGRSFCALGDAAATPYPGAMKYFANEFTAATHTSADEQFDPIKSYVFAGAVSAGAVTTGAST